MWCNTFGLQQGCGAILLDLNKGVVLYFANNGVVHFWLKQGCGALLLGINKGVVQYFGLNKGVVQYFLT